MRFRCLIFALSAVCTSGFQVSQQPGAMNPHPSSRLYAANEVATLGSLGPLDFGLFLIPVGALVVRASAMNDRNELQLEIETSQKFLEDAKQRLIKVEEAIKLSSIAGVLSFAFVLAFQLGVFAAPPLPEPVVATADTVSTTVLPEVSKTSVSSPPKAEPKAETKVEPKEDSSKPGEESSIKKEEVKIENELEKTEEEADKQESVKKEELVQDTSVEKEETDVTTDEAPYEDLMKKLEEPKTEEKASQNEVDEKEKVIEEQKVKAEQKAKEFVELEGGML